MADTPLRVDADPQWQALHAAAATWEAAFARVVLAALTQLAVTAEVRAALDRNDLEAALHALPLTALAGLSVELAPLYDALARAGATVALRSPVSTGTLVVRLGSADGLPVQEIADWAMNHAAAMVTAVTTETRFAIRDILVDAVHSGAAPRETAKLLEGVLGLNRRQAAALERYRTTLAAEAMPLARLDRLVARYATRLLRQRATAIARTETLLAANRGRQAVWERDVAAGLIDPHRWVQEWAAIMGDPRTCPECEALDGTRAAIGEPFPAPGGDGPPAHTSCRCTVVLVRQG